MCNQNTFNKTSPSACICSVFLISFSTKYLSRYSIKLYIQIYEQSIIIFFALHVLVYYIDNIHQSHAGIIFISFDKMGLKLRTKKNGECAFLEKEKLKDICFLRKKKKKKKNIRHALRDI